MNLITLLGLILATAGLVLRKEKKTLKEDEVPSKINISKWLIILGIGALWLQTIGTIIARNQIKEDLIENSNSNTDKLNSKFESESKSIKKEIENSNYIKKVPPKNMIALGIEASFEIEDLNKERAFNEQKIIEDLVDARMLMYIKLIEKVKHGGAVFYESHENYDPKNPPVRYKVIIGIKNGTSWRKWNEYFVRKGYLLDDVQVY